jgi:hypothetical protein
MMTVAIKWLCTNTETAPEDSQARNSNTNAACKHEPKGQCPYPCSKMSTALARTIALEIC